MAKKERTEDSLSTKLPPYKMVLVADLVPYANNARTHSDEQVAQISASIKEFGFTNPVLIDADNGIIAGHGRVLAAQKIGMDSVPCIELGWLTETQKRAYILADNKLALNAGWDDDLLKLELGALKLEGFDVSLTGFSDLEFRSISPAETVDAEPQLDRAEELLKTWKVERGQVWRIGNHCLMCGDSTSPEDVGKLLAGAKPLLMVTDPPYGVEYDPTWRDDAAKAGKIGFSATRLGKVANDDRIDWSEAYSLFPGDVAYVWHAGRHARAVQESLDAVKFEVRTQVIWAKPSFSISRGHYNWQHEPCFYAVRKGAKAHWVGDMSQSTLWKIDKKDGNDQGSHGTQKPLECMARPIRNHGGDVYDPFVGSGTTIIAAENCGRKCYAMEIEPKYVAVCHQRLADIGLTPELVNG